MPFTMMWMPYDYYWKAIFASQRMIADLMGTMMFVKPRQPRASIAEGQTSPTVLPANEVIVDVAAESKERPSEHPHAKQMKLLPARRRQASKKSKRIQKKGRAKVANLKGRRASAARA